jgi:hypothetical protein
METAEMMKVAQNVFVEHGIVECNECFISSASQKEIHRRVGAHVASLVADIAVKNADALLSRLHTVNPASREVFFRLTGIKLSSTNKATARQIDEWAGITPEERAQRDAQAKREAKEAIQRERRDAELRALATAWGILAQITVRGGTNAQEHLRKIATKNGTFSEMRYGAVIRLQVTWEEDGTQFVFPQYSRKLDLSAISTVFRLGKKYFGTLSATLEYLDTPDDAPKQGEAT